MADWNGDYIDDGKSEWLRDEVTVPKKFKLLGFAEGVKQRKKKNRKRKIKNGRRQR